MSTYFNKISDMLSIKGNQTSIFSVIKAKKGLKRGVFFISPGCKAKNL